MYFQNSHACLRFSSIEQIKTSQMYVFVHELVTEIDRQNRDVRFERLHARCVFLLRLIYRYRKRCDEMLVFRIFVFASKFVTLCIETFKITGFFSTAFITSNKIRMATRAMKILNWQRLVFMHQQWSPILNAAMLFSTKSYNGPIWMNHFCENWANPCKNFTPIILEIEFTQRLRYLINANIQLYIIWKIKMKII